MAVLISGATKILTLIGDPISQARSPAMANVMLEQQGRLGEYVLVPLHVQASDLAQTLVSLRNTQNFYGAIVTMPHKSVALSLLDEVTADAQCVGAVNVIRRTQDGKLVGTIMDGEGFVGGLKNAGHAVAEKNCLLIGAGGAASAIAFALVKHGCASLDIVNRTHEKAQALCDRLQRQLPNGNIAVPQQANKSYDIVINGTSLGMKEGDPLPVADNIVDKATLVAECVIAPEMTPLLQLAQQRGCAIHTGVPMLEAQMAMMLEFMGVGR